MPWCQTPSRKKKSVVFTTVTMRTYHCQLNAGFSEVCEICKVRSMESLKCVQEFYTPVCYCGDIYKPLNMMWHKTKHDCLLYLSVIWPLGRPWPFKASKVLRPSAVSLKIWLRETVIPNLYDLIFCGTQKEIFWRNFIVHIMKVSGVQNNAGSQWHNFILLYGTALERKKVQC